MCRNTALNIFTWCVNAAVDAEGLYCNRLQNLDRIVD